jgi:hypothetical protein
VGGPRRGEAPIVQQEPEQAGYQGDQQQAYRLGPEARAQVPEGALRQRYRRQGCQGEQQPRAGEGVEGDVPQDEPAQRRRCAPERRRAHREQGARGGVRAERGERAQVPEGDEVSADHRRREERPVGEPQALPEQDVGESYREERLYLLQEYGDRGVRRSRTPP